MMLEWASYFPKLADAQITRTRRMCSEPRSNIILNAFAEASHRHTANLAARIGNAMERTGIEHQVPRSFFPRNRQRLQSAQKRRLLRAPVEDFSMLVGKQ